MSDKFYVIHVFADDYFFTMARSRKEAIQKLQDYWNPITDGMGKLFISCKGFSLNSLREGRHLEFYKVRIQLEEEKKIKELEGKVLKNDFV